MPIASCGVAGFLYTRGMKRYTDGKFTGTFAEWCRILSGGAAEFEAAFRSGFIDEVTNVEVTDEPPFM